MVLVESLRQGEGWFPRLLYFDAWFDTFKTVDMLLVGEDLYIYSFTFIFCEITLLDSEFFHIYV